MVRIQLKALLLGAALITIVMFYLNSGCSSRFFSSIEGVSFSADGSKIAVSELNAWDAETELKLYKQDISRTVSLLDASDGATLGMIRQDFKPGNCGPAFKYWWRGRNSIAIEPNSGGVLAVGFGGGDLFLTSGTLGGETTVIPLEEPAINIAAVSKSGRFVACGGLSALQVVDLESRKVVLNARVDSIPFLTCQLAAFTNDESRIVIAQASGVQVWNIGTSKEVAVFFRGWEPTVDSISMLPDDTVVIGTGDWIRRFDLSGKVVSTLPDYKERYACAISPNGHLAAFVVGGDIIMYDIPHGKLLYRIPETSTTTLEFSPDNSSIALGRYGGTVILIDAATGHQRWRSDPPGRYRWPWTISVMLLAAWGLVAWRVLRTPASPPPSR